MGHSCPPQGPSGGTRMSAPQSCHPTLNHAASQRGQTTRRQMLKRLVTSAGVAAPHVTDCASVNPTGARSPERLRSPAAGEQVSQEFPETNRARGRVQRLVGRLRNPAAETMKLPPTVVTLEDHHPATCAWPSKSMGESESLSNFSEGGVAPTELPATTPTAQRKRPPYFRSPPTGRDIPHR